MRNWKHTLVRYDESIIATMRIIESSALQIALVVNEIGQLLGTVTDGDIRKAILRGVSLDEKVDIIMNKNPVYSSVNDSRDTILFKMKQKKIHQIPILDQKRLIVGLEILDEIVTHNEKENWVFLLAGGLGTRLGALTENCPKPLLNVGCKPILETIIESFAEYGYRNFYLSVNYKAKMIQDHFKDGNSLGVNIQYISENTRMGTAGSLSLLPEKPRNPMIIMNGDILTKINFDQLMTFHEEHKAKATICVREYSVHVPYGVVQMDNYKLTNIIEKPKQTHFVSAGIYVLDPDTLDYIPQHQYFDMPDLFKKLMEEKSDIMAYPIREYWLDIGSKVDYDKANGDYENIF